MTARGLSAWFGLGTSLLAILVAVERPHWFGLASSAPARVATGAAAAPDPRTTPWLIKRDIVRAR